MISFELSKITKNMSLQINNSNVIDGTINPYTAMQSYSFFNALYKNIPNIYQLKDVPFFENIEHFITEYENEIIDYYIEKSYVAALDKVVIENVFMVIKEDILLYYNRVSRECTIMYLTTPKQKVHELVKYILNIKHDC